MPYFLVALASVHVSSVSESEIPFSSGIQSVPSALSPILRGTYEAGSVTDISLEISKKFLKVCSVYSFTFENIILDYISDTTQDNKRGKKKSFKDSTLQNSADQCFWGLILNHSQCITMAVLTTESSQPLRPKIMKVSLQDLRTLVHNLSTGIQIGWFQAPH